MFGMSQPWEDLLEVSRQMEQCKRAKGEMSLACSGIEGKPCGWSRVRWGDSGKR